MYLIPKGDRCRRWSRIKINSNYIDRVSRNRFPRDLGRLFFFEEEEIKKMIVERFKKE